MNNMDAYEIAELLINGNICGNTSIDDCAIIASKLINLQMEIDRLNDVLDKYILRGE